VPKKLHSQSKTTNGKLHPYHPSERRHFTIAELLCSREAQKANLQRTTVKIWNGQQEIARRYDALAERAVRSYLHNRRAVFF